MYSLLNAIIFWDLQIDHNEVKRLQITYEAPISKKFIAIEVY